MFHCSECHVLAPIDWPLEVMDGVWAALLERPSPQTRNWYPEGHPEAISWGVATGQSAADLRTEAQAREEA